MSIADVLLRSIEARRRDFVMAHGTEPRVVRLDGASYQVLLEHFTETLSPDVKWKVLYKIMGLGVALTTEPEWLEVLA